MKMKKFLAVAMAATMVVGSGVTAMATSGTTDYSGTVSAGNAKDITGSGTEAFVDKNVMKVTVPTTLEGLFSYKVDPQGLVSATGSYDGVEVEGDATGVVFKNAATDGGKATISSESDPVKITNKSSVPVKMAITVKATDAASNAIATTTLADSADFTTTANSGKALYLGLKSTNDIEKALTGNAVTSANILLSGASQYEPKYESGSYVWGPKANATFSDYTFSLTGAINKALPNSTWVTEDSNGKVTAIKNPPTVSVKFTLEPIYSALPAVGSFFGADDLQFVKGSATDFVMFGASESITNIEINGRTLADEKVTKTSDGIAVVELEDLVELFDSSADVSNLTADEKAKYKSFVKSVKFETSGNTYYGEVL